MQYVLRDYQQIAVDDAINCFKTKKNGILVLPTGSGKSLIIASITQKMGGKTIILQPTKEILEQNHDKLKTFVEDEIGIYSASMGQKYIGRITLATIGSIINKKELFADFDRILVDECHGVNSKGGMYEEFIKGLSLPCLGLTATPYRLRHYNDFATGYPVVESRILTRTRPRIFNKIVHVTQVGELFDSGFLCPLDYDWQNNYDSKKIKRAGMGFNDSALERYNKTQGITDKIVDIVSKTNKEHCLVFTKLTCESKIVVEALCRRGIKCSEVSAETKKKDREDIISHFKSGDIKCVVNVGVLTTGFDFPELDCIVLGRPTNSISLYYQMTGRGIRISEGKESCSLHDLCDNVKRFGQIESFEIFDQNGNGMWRLKSSNGNQTGVNVITGEDVEKFTQPSTKGIISFGKHKGKKIADVDDGYLKWCVENFDNGKIKALFKKELKRREAV